MKRYGDVTVLPAVIHPNTPDPSCACGLTKCDRDGWVYCQVTALAKAARTSAGLPLDGPLSSAELLAAFDKMAASRRHQTAAEFRAFDRQRKGIGAAQADTTRPNGRKRAQPSLSPCPESPALRCIANIATTKKRVAHQCRNRAKYGLHCALHATGHTPPDMEQFPAALVETPDNLPFAHDD